MIEKTWPFLRMTMEKIMMKEIMIKSVLKNILDKVWRYVRRSFESVLVRFNIHDGFRIQDF